ncbi:a2333052-5ccc-479d-96c1-1e7bf8818402 [Sclerotinia trifoliorum]|uniref:A2333052-5ccc-479d-96c1-1e7bf8818402 n=1 Tax=Sclerotinia trifoliorum TaxID=28548 RepID=A0A8H2ZV86_9HELO|nr:a2333052-5ccc-479d-96c1-1e7bf8818402 [Sclerotinia trifoliorum]
MLNNAEPRIVSDGFDVFVANHCMIPVQETFFEMNSNNAWSINNPPTPEGWEQNFENFRDYKNFPLFQNTSGDFCQDTTALSTDQESERQRTSTHAVICPRQEPNKGHSFSIPLHPAPSMVQDYGSSPTLGIDYSHMNMDHGRRSFAAFQNCRSSTPSSIVQVSSSTISPAIHHFSSDSTSPNATYSDLPTSATSLTNTNDSIESSSAVPHDGLANGWWSDRGVNHMNRINNHTGGISGFGFYETPSLSDGLPRVQDEQREIMTDYWNHTYLPASNWPPSPFIPSTVRPKALNLSASFASSVSTATTECSQISAYSSESTAVVSSPEYTPSPSPTGEQSVANQARQTRARQMLPSSRPARNSNARIQPNDRTNPDSHLEPQLVTKRPAKHRRGKAETPIISAVANTRSHTIIKDPVVATTPKNNVPKGVPPSTIGDAKLRGRSEQNEFLVRSRRAGMSYKTIRSSGKFTAAESTLRGRFRTLTKDKKDRVRKPEWTENDLRLLSKAVKEIGRNMSDGSEPQGEWKKVAEYIADNGGSYRFGYATCRKRWVALKDADKGT